MLLLPWLVFALPGAANATGEAGAGAGLGDETDFQTNPVNPPPTPPLCLKVTQSEYVVTATGTVTANDGAVIYQGSDIVITITTDDDYYVSPEGTYGVRLADGSCDPTSFGPLGDIATTVTVNATGGTDSGVGTGANVANPACSGTGEYFRVNTNFTVTWRAATCDVNGNGANGAFEEVNTDFVFEGSLRPCTPLPEDPCEDTLQGAYSQT